MKLSKRLFSALFALLLSASVLSSCGGTKDGDGALTAFDPNVFTEPETETETEAVSEPESEPEESSSKNAPVPAVQSDFVMKRVSDDAVWIDAYTGRDSSVTIPSTDPESGDPVTGIDVWAFRDNDKVKKVVIPESVETIGNNAFMYCTSLEEVVMPSTLKSIGDQAFYRCSALRRIYVPDGIEKLGYAQFMFCEALEEIVLPSTLRELGNNVFSGCTSLGSICFTGSDSEWYQVKIADNAMPPTWYNISFYYGQW